MAISRSNGRFPLLPAAFVAVPLACGPWFRDGYGMPKLAIAAAGSLAGALFLLPGWKILSLRSQVDWPLSAFGALAVLCACFSIDRELSWLGDRLNQLFSVLGLAGCIAAFYLGCAEASQGAARLIRWAVAGAFPVCAYALLQAAGFEPLGWLRPMQGGLAWQPTLFAGRVVSTFGQPVLLGAYLAMIAPLALHLGLEANGSRLSRAGGRASLLALMAALALTGSRSAWLGAALACAWVSWAHVRRHAALAIAVPLIVAVIGLRARPASTWAASDGFRLGIWRTGLEAWKDHPWLGSGPGTFVIGYARHQGPALAAAADGYPSNAHDDWLEALTTTGVAGFAAYAWLTVAAARAGVRAAKGNPADKALAAALLAAVVVAKFNPLPLAAAWLASGLAGCLLAAPSGAVRERVAVFPGLVAALSAVAFASGAAVWARADRQDALGMLSRAAGSPREAAEHFEAALALRPGTAAYVSDLDKLLWDAASGLALPQRLALLDRCAEVAEEGIAHHPLDATLYRLLAAAQMRRAESGRTDGLGKAASALDASDALDPYASGTPRLRRDLSQLGAVTSGG